MISLSSVLVALSIGGVLAQGPPSASAPALPEGWSRQLVPGTRLLVPLPGRWTEKTPGRSGERMYEFEHSAFTVSVIVSVPNEKAAVSKALLEIAAKTAVDSFKSDSESRITILENGPWEVDKRPARRLILDMTKSDFAFRVRMVFLGDGNQLIILNVVRFPGSDRAEAMTRALVEGLRFAPDASR